MIIIQFAGMRSYSNKIPSANSSYQRRVERQVREDTEWDLRMDVTNGLSAEDIVTFIKSHLDDFVYVMVSGVETPDVRRLCGANTMASSTLHVHIGIVVKKKINRAQAFDLIRPAGSYTPSGSTYAAPRSRKQPYAGWVYHHSKMIFRGEACKLDGEPELRYEHGTLPMDEWDNNTISIIHYRRKSFGTIKTKLRFQHYQDAFKLAQQLGQINKDGAVIKRDYAADTCTTPSTSNPQIP